MKNIKESLFDYKSPAKDASKKLSGKRSSIEVPSVSDELYQKDLANTLNYEEMLTKILEELLFKKK
jgi:hypothetical protein